MWFPSSASHVSRAQQDGLSATPTSSPISRGGKAPLQLHTPTPCPPRHPCGAITCLLEDMLVSVLMLLVSVTTMAEGKREVWEYWGGSCLCAYTAGRRAQVREKPPQGGNGQQGDRDEVKQGKNPPLPSKALHSQAAAHPQKPVGIEGLCWTRGMEWGKEGMRQDVTTLHH